MPQIARVPTPIVRDGIRPASANPPFVFPVEAIPNDLRDLPRWACWHQVPSTDGGKPGKPPINATEFTGQHRYAKVNDPTTWTMFDKALAYWQRYLRDAGPASGLSFALNGDGIVGIDLDGCRDPKTGIIHDDAVDVIERFSTYTEVSPSGTGIRLFLRGTLPPGGRHRGKIEVYGDKKFLSVTGHKVTDFGAGDGIVERLFELAEWHDAVFGDAATSTANGGGQLELIINDPPVIDAGLLSQLFRSKPKAKDTFEGKHKYKSQSEADLALANFAVACGWCDQTVCDMLVQARLNVDEPIKHPTYFERTVAKAREGCQVSGTNRFAKAHASPAPSPLQELLGKHLASLESDDVEIGSPDAPNLDNPAGSMADVMKRIDGVKFLVPGYIPFAMLSMILAEPGRGKSMFALWLVRTIISGCNWFTGGPGPAKPGFALWCDTEGSAALNVQRIKNWELPADRIKVPFENDLLLAVDLESPDHLAQIEAVICKYSIPLVVIDSLRGAHGGDENSSQVVQVLKALARIAERTKAAIVIVHHTRKLMLEEEISANSSRGSNAIQAMVRAQLAIDKPDPKSEWSRLQMLKENLGLKPKPIGFRISEKGLEFGEAPSKPHQETEKDRAAEWLRAHMEPGKWYKAGDLEDEAEQDGISKPTLGRARRDLGIVKPNYLKKEADHWEWMLPGETKTAARTGG